MITITLYFLDNIPLAAQAHPNTTPVLCTTIAHNPHDVAKKGQRHQSQIPELKNMNRRFGGNGWKGKTM